MGRPVNADADATRSRILHSAVDLFSAKGLDGTSIREVAAGAGVTLATVHHYFGSKESLHESCMALVYDELGAMAAELGAVLARDAPLRDSIALAVGAGFRFGLKRRTIVRLLIRTSIATGRVPERGRGMLLEQFLPAVSEHLGAALGRPPDDLRLPLQTLIFLVARYVVQDPAELAVTVCAAKVSRREALDRVERHLVDVALAMLHPAP
jgi:AcrR family transcriptional regulator